MLYIANVGEDEIGDEDNDKVKAIREYAEKEDSEVIVISAKIEEEIATLDDEDKEMFLEDLGIEEPGLDRLIRTTYDLLGLSTYFTAGVQEVRAWTFRQGMTAHNVQVLSIPILNVDLFVPRLQVTMIM